jgi:hypothetical protein
MDMLPNRDQVPPPQHAVGWRQVPTTGRSQDLLSGGQMKETRRFVVWAGGYVETTRDLRDALRISKTEGGLSVEDDGPRGKKRRAASGEDVSRR